MFKKVDFVASASEIFDDIYCESLGIEKSAIIHTGSVMADSLYDDKAKKKAMEKMYKNI